MGKFILLAAVPALTLFSCWLPHFSSAGEWKCTTTAATGQTLNGTITLEGVHDDPAEETYTGTATLVNVEYVVDAHYYYDKPEHLEMTLTGATRTVIFYGYYAGANIIGDYAGDYTGSFSLAIIK